jgi:hypothetical protein
LLVWQLYGLRTSNTGLNTAGSDRPTSDSLWSLDGRFVRAV